MKRLLLFLLLASPLLGQNQTTVTGTLVDPNGIAYYPATVIACLSPVTLNPKVAGNSINLNQGANYCIGPVNTTRSGFFQMALYTNASIVPAATTWIFTVSAAGTPPPGGNGTLNFSSAGVTISGTSQDVSTNINSVGPAQSPSSATATNATNLVGPGTITGNYTSTGTINCTIINAIRCISPANPQGWAGSDLGAWINAAQTNCAGSCVIQVASGTYTLSTATNIGNMAGTVKTAVELGAVTITASAAITIYFGSSLYGPPASREGNIASYGIPAVIKQANSANLNAVIQCGDGTNSGNNCNVHDLLIDGNGTNNPSTNYLLLANKSSGFEWFRVSVQSSALHGFGVVSSTNGDEACCGRIYSLISQSNTGSGLFIKDSSDLSVTGTRSEFESNTRYGVECQTCGGLSFIGNETSTNLLGGISITNDAANLTGNANIHIIANRLTNNGGHGIQMTGQAVSTTDSFIIANNIVAGTNTTSNTFDGINLLGVSTMVVSNNHILNGSAHTYRYGINVQAGTGGDNWNLVSGNDFDIAGGAFGTGLFLGTSLTSFQTNLEGTTGQAQLTGPYVANTIPYSSKNAGGTVVPLIQMDNSSNLLIGADATQKFIQIRPNGMASGSNTVNITPGGTNFGMSIAPAAAGASDLGAASIPWGNLWLGTAATNNFQVQPAATTGARILKIADWGANGSSTQNQPFVITLTSQYTNSTTTFSNVAGGNTIQFAVAANSNYTATCHLYYQAAATGGLNIEFTGPASPTAVRYGMDLPTAVTGVASGEADAFGTSIGAVSTAGAVNLDAMVSFSLLNGANAGTVNLLAKSSAAVQLQIQSGSYCQIQ